ncbi:hypothetical protein HIM_01655 [Hirsutella minnesotensis 3608]|nr:hypothetical protein HIM_01655 [Hirsutella minnesotensis 3608]
MVGSGCRYAAAVSTTLAPMTPSGSALDMTTEYDPLTDCQGSLSHVQYAYGGACAPNYPTPRASSYLAHEATRFTVTDIPRDCSAGLDRHLKQGQRNIKSNEPAFGHASYSISSAFQESYGASLSPFPISSSADAPVHAGSAFRSQAYSSRPSANASHPRLQASPPSSTNTAIMARARRVPRKHTTKEEANFQCSVQGCGKFFSRSYNYKSHMETHDEQREYPFPCLIGGCSKKFVRKTDLQRHHQSVHKKERNHGCDFCGRLFARKDTLRRHMEDGCSKRFDIETLDLRSDSLNALSPPLRDAVESTNQAASVVKLLPPVSASIGQTPIAGRSAQVSLAGQMTNRSWER